MRKRVKYIIVIILAIIFLLGFLFLNLQKSNPNLDKSTNTLIQGKQNLIAVYKDKLAVVIPFDLRIDKEKTVGDLVKNNGREKILEDINKIMPEPLAVYTKRDYPMKSLPVKYKRNIPQTVIDNQKYIITSSLYSMFNDLYNEKDLSQEPNQNIIVDVLNANGINGYARRTGEKINKNLGMKYNAANFDKQLDQSFIVLNNIAKEKAQDIVMQLNEKYFVVENNYNIPTLANVVVVLGKEENIPFNIEIQGNKSGSKSAFRMLQKAGYKKISIESQNTKADKKVIEYNPKDYFTAYKISKILNIPDMIESENLQNKIKVIVN